MKNLMFTALLCIGLASSAMAQMAPWVVPFNGVVTNAAGQPLSGAVTMTFALFDDPNDGAPLWVEVQVVNADAQGQYVAFLGASTDGMPAGVLGDGSPRWLASQADNQPEQARVQLLSVPYSLKAADAETLGGLPASAYLTANGTGSGALSSSSGESAPTPDNADLLAGSGEVGTLSASSGDGLVDVSGDQVILDDLIVDGSICVGQDCVNGESFGFDTIRLKENNLRIKAVDTSSTSSFPTQDWQITFNDSSNGGQNKFSIDAISPEVGTPFTIEAGAPSHSLYVDDGGRIGMGTNTPVTCLHCKEGNTPTLRLEQDGSSGFAPQTWDVAGNEAGFFIRDATNGSTLPFRIRPSAPSSSIDIAGTTGNVGMGTSAPSESLHIRRTDATPTRVRIENTNGGTQNADVELVNNSGSWTVRNNTLGSFVVNTGATPFELELSTAGDLAISGGLTVVGNCSDGDGGGGGVDGCDYVFHPDYELPTIEEHATQMWGNSYLPAVGPTPEDAPWNLGRKSAGMLNELEKAHIYIEQLHNRMADYEHQVADYEHLTQRLENLEAKLATLAGEGR